MQMRVKEYVKVLALSILCFSMLTLPYHLPNIETTSNNIVDVVSSNLHHNPFSSTFFMTVKSGNEINLVSNEFRFINTQVFLKDIEALFSLTPYFVSSFRNPLPVKSLPLFLFKRYLRI